LTVPTFLFLGSGEFEPWSTEVETIALADAVGDGSVAILPTASAAEGDHVFERWGQMGLAHYRDDGVPAAVVPIETPEFAGMFVAIPPGITTVIRTGVPRHSA